MSGDRQTRVYFARPIIGNAERAAALGVLSTGQLTNAGAVMAFEEAFQQFIGGGLAIAVSSCTAALHLACMSLFKSGDEVIVPALTHAATAHAVEAMGATPVFADVSRETGCIDFRTIELLVTERTKGIVIVHYLGVCRDTAMIVNWARHRKIAVIEDCALALGGRFPTSPEWSDRQHDEVVHVGLLGDVGCFSFYPAKHITTGEGGMAIVRRKGLYDDIKRRRQFGQYERMGDITVLGLNYRMTEMAAAVGIVQLGRFTEFARRRARNHSLLRAGLRQGILGECQVVQGAIGTNYAISVFMKERDALRKRLKDVCSIETSIYYPRAVPSLKYYRGKYRFKPGDFPNAEAIAAGTICLPLGPHLADKHMQHMIKSLRKEC